MAAAAAVRRGGMACATKKVRQPREARPCRLCADAEPGNFRPSSLSRIQTSPLAFSHVHAEAHAARGCCGAVSGWWKGVFRFYLNLTLRFELIRNRLFSSRSSPYLNDGASPLGRARARVASDVAHGCDMATCKCQQSVNARPMYALPRAIVPVCPLELHYMAHVCPSTWPMYARRDGGHKALCPPSGAMRRRGSCRGRLRSYRSIRLRKSLIWI